MGGYVEIDYFLKQAEKFVADIQKNNVSVNDVAAALRCLYSAGVIDSAMYTEDQKKEMFSCIKRIYKIGDMYE
jgi:hypothetical protein